MEMAAWLDQPVMLHSSRADACKLTAEQCAYRSGHWRYWYEADHVYALGTTYFFIAVIALCAVSFWTIKIAPNFIQAKSWWQKLVGVARFLAYRRHNVNPLRWRTPSLGVGTLLVIGSIFFFAMTLGPQPYYWPNTQTLSFGSSPPIATRTGWMSLACLPFMIILPTRANIIASLTGVSHERLIVFHNWVGWAMFILALIHTFPFIIFHIWKGDMTTVWKTSVVYWTGVAALLPQFYLQVMSLPFIRNRYYEFFKITHYIVAIIFIVFFFLHCDFRLTSWDYFIVTGVLYTLSWLYSHIRSYFEFGITHKASFEMMSEICMKITIPINTTWKPAQHVFLRFITLGAHSMTAHPFTICSVPNVGRGSLKKPEMVFYIHPRGGLTGRLAKLASQQPGYTIPVLIDGPYGGIKGKSIHSYDRSLIVSCGSGAALSLGLAMDVLARRGSHPRSEAVKVDNHMQIVIATRDSNFLEWYEDALISFFGDAEVYWPAEAISISVYQTGLHNAIDYGSSGNVETKGTSEEIQLKKPKKLPIEVFSGRPDISVLVRKAALQSQISLGILACGPAGVLAEVQNEAATAQLRIVRSEPGAREVYLHSEHFSW